MDKNVLKKFALESRQELMEKIANKINRYFVDEYFDVNQNGEVYVLINNKHTLRLTKNEYENRQLLVKRIKEITLEQVIEEAAYTWFNRIIAIRYMEIHDFLPLTKGNQSLGVRVLSSKDNTPDPEIMKISNLINPELDINFNKEYYGSIQDNNKRFEYILLLVCKKIGKVIPQVFDGVTDYIDILIPDNLLNDSGYVTKLLKDVSEDNFEQVEIIGWLYQYYNQTEKDRVISAKKAYKKNEIPYATQLFTPDWIVKYMVENSLGLYWIEHGGNKNLIKKWKYFIRDVEIKEKEKIDPKYIKCIDPCCGSGHILVYMFEVLYQIYESYGYNKNDISRLILKNNLYGLDIDDRAGQLSILSVILKAREFDKNIFLENIFQDLNVTSIQETNYINKEVFNILKKSERYDNDLNNMLENLYEKFQDAKEIGSLLIIDDNNYDILLNLIEEISNNAQLYDLDKIKIINEKFIPIINTARILKNKYDVIVTNPPYLNYGMMPSKLKNYVFKNYQNSKTDLCVCFINWGNKRITNDGYSALVTMQSWMFLSSFANFRKDLIDNYNICNLMHMENNVMRIVFGTCATIFCREKINRNGIYFNVKYENISDKNVPYEFPIPNNPMYSKQISDYQKIPGNNIAYWVSDNLLHDFEIAKPFSEFADLFQGIITGDNEKFLRFWYELNINKISFNQKSMNDINLKESFWIPYNKGGAFRKWYGNQDYVVNWKNGPNDKTRGKESFSDYYLREYVSWSYITSSTLASRYFPYGFLWDVSGSGFFDKTNNIKYLNALLGSVVGIEILKLINPTVNYQVENVSVIPVLLPKDDSEKKYIEDMVDQCINISAEDWDDYEISWNFKKNPIIKRNNMIDEAINEYRELCTKRYEICNTNEEKINKFFIDLYKTYEYSEKVEDTTIRIPTNLELIKNLISYSIGCIFGRYSLDEDGLIYAGGEFNRNMYTVFEVVTDNIIPLTTNNYFGDDIVSRFKDFLKTIYGKETLYENLEFIAETLGKRNGETSEDTIRRYFINDFYNDHLKIYQKRPIYWLFDSGKKNGFKCLIYMHRYNEGLVSKIRLDYLHKIQNIYEKELKEISDKLDGDIDLTKKRELAKKQADISAKLQETKEYDEKIAHIADQRIKIDLDDGVVVNYAKFSVKNPKTGKDESILAKIK